MQEFTVIRETEDAFVVRFNGNQIADLVKSNELINITNGCVFLADVEVTEIDSRCVIKVKSGYTLDRLNIVNKN